MVKEKKTPPVIIVLDPALRNALQHEHGDIHEQVTVPDMSPSLYQIVMTGNVGSMPGNSSQYNFPDLGDDDEAHEHPDYMKLHKEDIVIKEQFVNEFVTQNQRVDEKAKEDVSGAPDAKGEIKREADQTGGEAQ